MSLDGVGGPAGAWLAAALLLALAELLIPGVFAIFLGIAAGITGLALLALPTLPVAVQMASFAVWSVVIVLIGRRWYSDYPVATSDPALNDRSARLVGTVVIVEAAIRKDGGRVRIGDGSWPARGAAASAGERVKVTAVRDGVAIVEAMDA